MSVLTGIWIHETTVVGPVVSRSTPSIDLPCFFPGICSMQSWFSLFSPFRFLTASILLCGSSWMYITRTTREEKKIARTVTYWAGMLCMCIVYELLVASYSLLCLLYESLIFAVPHSSRTNKKTDSRCALRSRVSLVRVCHICLKPNSQHVVLPCKTVCLCFSFSLFSHSVTVCLFALCLFHSSVRTAIFVQPVHTQRNRINSDAFSIIHTHISFVFWFDEVDSSMSV